MKDAGTSRHDGRTTGCLDSDELCIGVDESREDPSCIRSTTDTGHDQVGDAVARCFHLRARLVTDHSLKFAHHPRERVRTHDRAQAIVRVVDLGDPGAHRLVHGIFERPTATRHGMDRCAEELHAEHVELLALGVDLTHVDRAFESHQCGGGG